MRLFTLLKTHFQKLVSSKRAILTLMSVLGILSAWNLLTPAPAYALFSIEDILGSAVGWVAFVLGYIIAYVGGVVIAMLVYSIGIILQLNTNIINTPAVQAGFSITLQFANLGFVLGVIIIAIATIIRYETYGMKQLLSRLIIAALLVNFSLVFAGGLLNFSDQLSGVFLRSLPGGGKGVNAFASAIGGAMSPQRYMLNNQGNSNLNTQENWSKWASAGAGTGRTLANILTPLVEIIFASAMILIIVVTIGAFFVMLTVRYIYLGLLLIIMPIAWLLWIFPNTRGQWTKWWKNFFKWTFFAPISLFFLWLAIITAEAMNNASKVDPLSGLGGLGYTPDITTNPAGQALSGFFGNLVNNILGSFLQGSIVVGLTVGGLLAAERFSIVGAHAALGAVKSVGSAAKGYVGKRMKQAATYPLRTETGKRRLAQMQQYQGRGLTRWTGAAWATRKVGRLLESGGVAMGEHAVGSYGGEAKKATDEQVINSISSASFAPERIAYIKEALSRKILHRMPVEDQERFLSEENREMFRRYDANKDFDRARDQSTLTLREIQHDWAGGAGTIGRPEYERRTREVAERMGRNGDASVLANVFPQNMREFLERLGLENTPQNQAMTRGIQEAAKEGIARGFSPTNMSAFFKELSEKQRIDVFAAVAPSAQAPSLTPQDFRLGVVDYFDRNQARDLVGDARVLFGLQAIGGSNPPGGGNPGGGNPGPTPPASGSNPTIIIPPGTGGPGPRSRTRYP